MHLTRSVGGGNVFLSVSIPTKICCFVLLNVALIDGNVIDYTFQLGRYLLHNVGRGSLAVILRVLFRVKTRLCVS